VAFSIAIGTLLLVAIVTAIAMKLHQRMYDKRVRQQATGDLSMEQSLLAAEEESGYEAFPLVNEVDNLPMDDDDDDDDDVL
jgi:type II secretory pathway pseudopilin PulG